MHLLEFVVNSFFLAFSERLNESAIIIGVKHKSHPNVRTNCRKGSLKIKNHFNSVEYC